MKIICPDCNGTGAEEVTAPDGSKDWIYCELCEGLGEVTEGNAPFLAMELKRRRADA